MFPTNIRMLTKSLACRLLLGLTGLLLWPTLVLAQGSTTGSVTLFPNNTTIGASLGLNLNANVTSNSTEVVTMGIPFADCTLTNTDHFRLFSDSGLTQEVPIFIKTTIEWPATREPCLAVSVRAVKVQFEFDATGAAPTTYYWDINAAGRGNADRLEVAVSEVAHDSAKKGGFKEPRVFAVVDPAYLMQTDLIAPSTVESTDVYDTNYFPEKWEYDSRDFDYTTGSLGNWLFDRVSTNYRQAMRRGDVDHYREAYVSHEFYIDKIEVTGTNTTVTDYCLGGFDYGQAADTFGSGGKGCDPKYIYAQNILLHLALTGDDSWQPTENGTPSTKVDTREEVWKAMADLLVQGSLRGGSVANQAVVAAAGFSAPYNDVTTPYTERKSGLGLQTLLAVAKLLPHDGEVSGWVDTVVNNMHSHQTSNPDGRGNLGYLAHSWREHEGSGLFWLGTLNADVTGSTSIVVNSAFTGSADILASGNMVRISGTDIALTATPTKNGDGTYNVSLASAVTATTGTKVFTTWTDTSKTLLNYNQSTDRAFSPWMQSMIVDGVWEYYFWSEASAQEQKAADLISGMGRAYLKYAIDGTRTPDATETLIETAFPGISIFDSGISAKVGCSLVKAPYTRYVGNDLMTGSEINTAYTSQMFASGGFSDQHIPEGLFQLATALFFETDPNVRAAMQQVSSDMLEWFENYTCTSGNKDRYPSSVSDPYRAFSWQSKPDPFGTYKYVQSFALSFDTDSFTEANANDGSITQTINLTIGGAKFADPGGAGTYASGTDFEVSNLPAGFTGATLTYINSSTAQLALTGAATANDPVNNIANLTFSLKDSALVGSFDADLINNSTKSDIAIIYINPKVTYSATTITESTANDGTVATQITIDLEGDTFTTNTGAFPGGSFTVTGLPAGTLAASLTANSATQAVLSFTGSASPHGNANETSSISFSFEDGAFTTTGTASDVTDFSKMLSVEFFEPTLSFSSTTFLENSGTNDGAIANSLTVTLADDTFVVPDGPMTVNTHFTVANVPAGLTLEVVGTSNTTATVGLSGTANANDSDITDLTLNFLAAALTTTTDVSNVVGANTNSLVIDYVAPALSYGGTTFNEDASSNNGSVSNSLAITLTDDTFTVPAGVMTQGTHFTVANLPAGLTAVVTGTSATTATFGLSGTASSNGNADEISNIQLAFLPAAFTNSISTANIPDASKSNISVSYVEPAIMYGSAIFNENAATNNGVIANTLSLTLGEDSFRCTSCSLVSGADFNAVNLPSGLGVSIDIDGTGLIATVTLTGAAATHENADDVSNFTLNFTDAAFSTSPAATILEAMKMDIAINFFQDGIEYDFTKFTESDNNGSTATVLNLTLLGDTFVITGGAMTESTHYTVAGVPAGMAALVTGTSGNSATLALTGAATSHADTDDVSGLTLTFLNAAFTGNDASVIANSSKNDLVVEFVDGNLSFAESVFHEATTNDGAIGNTIEISLTGDKFVAGVFTSPTHFTASNVPTGLTAVVTRNSDSSATFSLTGNATSSDNSDDVSDLGLTFTGAAFVGNDAGSVNGSSKSDFQVDFVDALISYSASVLTESAANTGIVDTTLNLTLVGDGFVINGGQMLVNTHFTVANVPDGLTAEVTGISSSQASFALSGTATSHVNANDVSNLNLTFLNAAFTNGNASNVGGSSRSDLSVDFSDPAASGGGSGGSSGGGSGGSSGSGSSGDSTNNESEPPEPTVPPVNTGTLSGLELTSSDSIQNQGTLVDIVNGGTVNGGTVSGTVTNSGTLNDVTLAAGTVVNGGIVSGAVSNSGTLNGVSLAAGTVVDGGKVSGALVGSGTVTNAVLDVTEVGSEVTLGKGVKITDSAAKSTSGLDLSAVIKGDDGELDLNQPILVTADNTEKSAADLAVDAVNALLGNGATKIEKNTGENTPTMIDNPGITGAVVVVTPSKVETTSEPDGVVLNSKGELQIVSNGIKIELAPSPSDSAAFTSALEANGATSNSLQDGVVMVDFNGSTFSFQFSYLATSPGSSDTLIRSQGSSNATFSEIGDISNPASYRIVVNFADGTSQELIPRIHDVDHFELWMAEDGLTIQIDGLTGIVSVYKASEIAFRGIPSYLLEQPQGSVKRVNLEGLTDVNGDGFEDLYYSNGKYGQLIYGVQQP